MKTISRNDFVKVVRESVEREEPLMLSPHRMEVSFLCIPQDVTEDQLSLLNPVRPDLIPWFMAAPSYDLHCRQYRATLMGFTGVGMLLSTVLPEVAELAESRNGERIYFPPRENALIEIQHPYDPATVMTHRLLDVSSEGLSFRVRRRTAFVQPGRALPNCRIHIPGKATEQRAARIVYVKHIFDLNNETYLQVGVQYTDNATPPS